MSDIKNKQVVSNLMTLLPSVYRDFIYDDNFIKLLLDTYVDVAGFVGRYAQSIYDNTSINTAEYFRNLEFATLTLKDSLYDVNKVAIAFYQAGIGNWYASETPLKDKVGFLDSLGLYETLSVQREWDVNSNYVISLKIARDFNQYLGYYDNLKDYVVKDNKLFLFNDLAKLPQTPGGEKTVLLTDIFIDVNKIENRWGTLLGNLKPNFISPAKYAQTISGTINSLNEGLTIKLLREVIANITEPSVNFFDKYSTNLPVRYKYDDFINSEGTLGELRLGEFDFIAELPASLFGTAEIRQYIIQVLNLMKPAYTNFSIYGLTQYEEEGFKDKYSGAVEVIDSTLFSKGEGELKFGVTPPSSGLLLNISPLNTSILFNPVSRVESNTGILNPIKSVNESRYQTVLSSYATSLDRILTETKILPLPSSLSILSAVSEEHKFGVELDTLLKLNSSILNSSLLGVATRINREAKSFFQGVKILEENKYPQTTTSHAIIINRDNEEEGFKDKYSGAVEVIDSTLFSKGEGELKFGVTPPSSGLLLNISPLNTSILFNPVSRVESNTGILNPIKSVNESRYQTVLSSYATSLDRILTETKILPLPSSLSILSAVSEEHKFGVTIEGALILNSSPLNSSLLVPTTVKELGGAIILTRVSDGYETIITF